MESFGHIEDMTNTLAITEIEMRLLDNVKKDQGTIIVRDTLEVSSLMLKYIRLMNFLSEDEDQVEQLIRTTTGSKAVNGVTNLVAQEPRQLPPQLLPCLASSIDGATNTDSPLHSMETCDIWAKFPVRNQERMVTCRKHPCTSNHTTTNCKFEGEKCKYCSKNDHHFLPCPAIKVSTNMHMVSSKTSCLGPRTDDFKSQEEDGQTNTKLSSSAMDPRTDDFKCWTEDGWTKILMKQISPEED